MTAQSKYGGQRLTAKQVLQRYAAGEREFRGAILDDCDFRGANLSGADFSRAKIRGTCFVDATLIRTKFCHAEAGPSIYRRIVQLLAVLIAIPCGFLQAVASFYLGRIFADFPGWFGGGILGADLTGQNFSIIIMATAMIILTTMAIVGARVIAGVDAVLAAAAVTTITILPVGVLGVLLGIVASIARGDNSASAFFITFAVVLGIAIAIENANFWLSWQVKQHIHRGDPAFEAWRGLSVWGGTTFNGANLTGASFASAILNKANFANSQKRSTILNRVRWQNAQQLERAHSGRSYLQNPKVRHLLTHLTGSGLNGQAPLDLSNIDLRGVNLAGAQLHRINLRKAI